MLELKKAKQYLRIDFDMEDDLLQFFIQVSIEYLEAALDDFQTLAEGEKTKGKVEMCQLVIVQDLYENRNQAGYGVKDFGYSIRSMIHQLSLEEGDEK